MEEHNEKKAKLWVGLRKGDNYLDQKYEFMTTTKYWHPKSGNCTDLNEEEPTRKEMEELTNLRLRPGQIKKVKSIKIEVE